MDTLDQTLEKKHLKLSNGETIAYLDYGAGERTIVLIHGNVISSLWW